MKVGELRRGDGGVGRKEGEKIGKERKERKSVVAKEDLEEETRERKQGKTKDERTYIEQQRNRSRLP